MFQLNYLGHLDQLWCSDELIDRDRDQLLMDYRHYLFYLHKDFLYLLYPRLHLHDPVPLNLDRYLLSDLNNLLNFNSHHFFLMNGDTLNTLFDHQLFCLNENLLLFLSVDLFILNFFDHIMGPHWLFNNKWHLLLHVEWHLHLDWLHLGLMNLHFLVLNTISVCLDWNFPDDLVRHFSHDFHLNNLLDLHLQLNNLLNLYCLVDNFLDNDSLCHLDLDWNFNSLHLYLRHRDLNYLELTNPLHHYLFNYLGDLHYLLHYPWDRHNLFNYPLNFNYSRHLHYLLNYPVDKLRLNLHDLLLNYHRNWPINIHRLHYFLPSSHNLDLLDLKLLDPFTDEGRVDLSKDRDLFSDIERNHLFPVDLLCHHNFLDDGLIDEDLNLDNLLLLVTLNEV